MHCASSLFTSYIWKRHFTKSSGLGNKVDEGPTHQDRVQEALEDICVVLRKLGLGWKHTWAPTGSSSGGFTFGGVDMESERKGAGQSPGQHQLARDSSRREASKERRQKRNQRGGRNRAHQTSSQSPSESSI